MQPQRTDLTMATLVNDAHTAQKARGRIAGTLKCRTSRRTLLQRHRVDIHMQYSSMLAIF